MKIKVSNSIIKNKVLAPPSKSFAQRAILAAALNSEATTLFNIGQSDDVQHILKIAQQLGAEVTQTDTGVDVRGVQNEISRKLNCGESGLGVRLTAPIVANYGGDFYVSGEGSLMNRPMHGIVDALSQLRVKCESNNGHLPLEISGRLKGADIEIDGSLSSQYLSGLLMALPLAEEDSIIHVKELNSIPYIDITLEVLKDFNIEIENNNYETFYMEGRQEYKSPEKYSIEGDWSGAAFWIVFGAISNTIEISGLNKKSVQADRMVLDALKCAGGKYEWINDKLIITKSDLKPFEFDATNCPDLFPILVTLAASIEGISCIKGVNRLKHKESDRGIVLQKEFAKLGLKTEIEGDLLRIHGTGELTSNTVNSNNDHRIAMCLAIAAVLTKNGVEITDASAINKSYPNFWEEVSIQKKKL
jgi:3-phosphoshikimate 1-carboxyvinyltransferase